MVLQVLRTCNPRHTQLPPALIQQLSEFFARFVMISCRRFWFYPSGHCSPSVGGGSRKLICNPDGTITEIDCTDLACSVSCVSSFVRVGCYGSATSSWGEQHCIASLPSLPTGWQSAHGWNTDASCSSTPDFVWYGELTPCFRNAPGYVFCSMSGSLCVYLSALSLFRLCMGVFVRVCVRVGDLYVQALLWPECLHRILLLR